MKIYKPGEAASPKKAGRSGVLREIMAEKAKTPLILLTCGHLTTWDDIQVYKAWQQKKDRFFCEQCGKWIDREFPKKRVDPPEPLF